MYLFTKNKIKVMANISIYVIIMNILKILKKLMPDSLYFLLKKGKYQKINILD